MAYLCVMGAGVKREANELINESSPYLLQHAYNPVKWLPFGPEAFEKAKRENKLVIVSVGYSACHWCHVMEHESFEDEEVADVMNRHFVSVKVDREERADVDMVYMQAVQLMTGHGGWPMNCFVLPDGKPCYGGTYFNKAQWLNILNTLARLYENEPAKIRTYADELTDGIRRLEDHISSGRSEEVISRSDLEAAVNSWRKRFDTTWGGPNHTPKFPMPSNCLFLLRYALLSGDQKVFSHAELTLEKMALGGINDQVHGGFSRYSTDQQWKVPHFEKMLYDNAQLAVLYLEAFRATGHPLYKEVARHTLAFVEREWFTEEGGFYSAFDADSEGEEGKYYVWSREELVEVLGDDFEVFSSFYLINEEGYWENGNYILMRNPDTGAALAGLNLTRHEMQTVIERCIKKLSAAAAKRTRPGLDDKIITSWNAMMCTAFCKAYLILGDLGYKEVALRSCAFLRDKLVAQNGHLMRTYKNGHARISGFLDDYTFLTEALINCYLATQEENYLYDAKHFCSEALRLFENPGSEFLYYTSLESEPLVARNTEISDNVIPSSNAQMAWNLTLLGHYFEKNDWLKKAEKMLSGVAAEVRQHPASYSHWAALALQLAWPLHEIVIVGKDVDEKLCALYRQQPTNTIFAVSAAASEMPLIKERHEKGKTVIYVCRDKTCNLPVESVEEALAQFD